MANQQCPKCGTHFPVTDGWARGAVSLLIAAPAVPDMATQVRCPNCNYLFADSEVRYLDSSGQRRLMFLIALLLALLFWTVF